MKYPFYTCDVFTKNRFGGNQLAVFPNASGLTDEQMQLIAHEFNFSESTFVFPPEKGNTCKLRIFTPQKELPFAGHPNIGTAFVLAKTGALDHLDNTKNTEQTTQVIFEEKAGLVPISIQKSANQQIWCELKAPAPLSLGKTFSQAQIASILSLSPDEIVIETHMPQQATVGIPFVIVELRDYNALKRVKVNLEALQKFGKLEDTEAFLALYVYIHNKEEFDNTFDDTFNDTFNNKFDCKLDIRGRMFAPLEGIAEDPATGSANCVLTGLLAHYNAKDTGEFDWSIAQGVEIQRPSLLSTRAKKQNSTVTDIWIGGDCVMVSEGLFEV